MDSYGGVIYFTPKESPPFWYCSLIKYLLNSLAMNNLLLLSCLKAQYPQIRLTFHQIMTVGVLYGKKITMSGTLTTVTWGKD
jgi:hypothetical protein